MMTDTFSAIYLVEKMKSLLRTPAGVLVHTAVTSLGGVVVLLLFLASVLSSQALLFALPAILAFNGAAGGFGLADKEEFFPYQKTGRVVLAGLLTVAGCTAIVLFCPWEPLFDLTRYLTSGAATLASTLFGGWIAKKNKRLKGNNHQ